jgi:uncharacterized protein (TIGR02172 family)
MECAESDGILVVSLVGRIDSANASAFSDELLAIAESRPELPMELDATELEYVSSAGLRGILKLLKQHAAGARVINASPEVYEIFDVTGFTQLIEVSRALRTVSVDGLPVVGKGGFGTVYRLDEDTIVKVYTPWMKLADIQRERDFARTAFLNGVPCPIAYDVVRVGDCLGVVFEMIRSDTLAHAMRDNPQDLEEWVARYVELVRTLHATHVPNAGFTDIHDLLHGRADRLGQWCTAEEIGLLHEIVDAMPTSDTLTHNDLHPGNIMVQDNELLIIDMPDVTLAPPVCDLIAIYRDMVESTRNSSALMEELIGMPAEMVRRVADMFFYSYTGIDDEAELAAYYEKLDLLCSFNVTFSPAGGGANGLKWADYIMENKLRQIVVPNASTIKELYQTL